MRAIGFAKNGTIKDINRPKIMKRRMLDEYAFVAFAKSFLPTLCPIRTVEPTAMPVTMAMIVCMVTVPVDTADTHSEVENAPTIIISTVPYKAWRRLASKIGKVKSINVLKTFPFVRSFSIVAPNKLKAGLMKRLGSQSSYPAAIYI